ncbi:MAG: YcxB family protein [Corallococcus sp.]|nr:YcxB family protein [Corallococcus sp.]
MIECYTTVTVDVYLEWKSAVRKAGWALLWLGVAGAIVCLLLIGLYDGAEEYFPVFTACVFLSALLFVCGRTLLRAKKVAKKQLGSGITYRYVFDKEYVEAYSPKGIIPTRYEYRDLLKVRQSKNYVYLYVAKRQTLIVSKAELGEENCNKVLSYIEEANGKK